MSTTASRRARFAAWNRASIAAARRTPARERANLVAGCAAVALAGLLVVGGQRVLLLVLAVVLFVGHRAWFGVVAARDRERGLDRTGADGAVG